MMKPLKIVNPLFNTGLSSKNKLYCYNFMIEIFTSKHCQNCKIVKQLFARKGYDFTEYDIEFSQALKKLLYQRAAGKHSWSKNWLHIDDVIVPVIYVGEDCIGTIDELYQLIESGQFNHFINEKINTTKSS